MKSLLKKLSNKKEWIHFPKVNNHMREDGVELKKPYSKFKTLVLDAEKRNLVETKSKGLNCQHDDPRSSNFI
jgi:hypothetical protein